MPQHDLADAHPFQAHHLQADLLAHAPDLALFPFVQHKAQLLRVLPFHLGVLERLPIQREAVAQERKLGRWELRLHIFGDRVVVINPAQLQ